MTLKYLKAVPVDPVAESSAWIIVPSGEGDKPGVADVRSPASGVSSSGVPYADL